MTQWSSAYVSAIGKLLGCPIGIPTIDFYTFINCVIKNLALFSYAPLF